MAVIVLMIEQHSRDRRDKGEAGAEIGRDFSFADQNVQQCSDTVHEKNHAGVNPEQIGNQHRAAEHGE
ncbi:hypothetical protein D3C87_1921240 [compost metagenome]